MTVKPALAQEWLGALHALLVIARRHGLDTLQHMLEHPEDADSLLSALPNLRKGRYPEFMADLVRMLSNEAIQDAEADRYVVLALESWRGSPGHDAHLLQMFALAIQYFLKGYSPDIACEFARQSLPLAIRPSYQAFFDWLETRFPRKAREVHFSKDTLKDDIQRFMASMGPPPTD